MNKALMTKKQAIEIFKLYNEGALATNNGPYINETWGIFTDSLCKRGVITMKQYETWLCPFKVDPKKGTY